MSAPDKHGWMPIETAPKDGTTIVFWSEDEGRHVGWYSDSMWIPHGARDSDGCAWVIDDPREYWITFHPTHWQPLPKPPVVQP